MSLSCASRREGHVYLHERNVHRAQGWSSCDTQEEKKAKEEKDAVIAAAKKRGQEKAKLTKSLIIMDVKPWDDTTGGPLSLGQDPKRAGC